MERRHQPRCESEAWATRYRLNRFTLTRVNARAPMSRRERRLTLVIWIFSICTALLAVAQLWEFIVRLTPAT